MSRSQEQVASLVLPGNISASEKLVQILEKDLKLQMDENGQIIMCPD